MVGFSELAIMVVMFAASGGYGAPMGIPPGAEEVFLHQAAPQDCVAYTSWSATTSLDPTRSPTEKHLAQPEILQFFLKWKLEMDRQAKMASERGDQFQAYRTLVMKLPELAMTHAGCMYIEQIAWPGDRWIPVISGTMIFDLKNRHDEFKTLVDDINDIPKPDDQNGTNPLGHLWAYAVDRKVAIVDGHLVIAFAGKGLEASPENVSVHVAAGEPQWLLDLKNELPVARRSSVSMLNFPKVEKFLSDSNASDMDKILKNFGIQEVGQVGWVTGLDENGYVSRTSIHCDPEPNGFLSLVDLSPLKKKEIAAIHKDRQLIFASKLSTEKLYSLIGDLADEVGGQEDFESAVGDFEAFSGISLRDDLLNDLDEYFYVYGDVSFDATANIAFGIGIRDAMSFEGTLTNFNKRIEEQVNEQETLELELTEHNGIEIRSVTASNFGWFSLTQQVSWAMVGDELVIGFDPKGIQSHIENVAKDNSFNSTSQAARLYEVANEIGSDGPVAIMSIDWNQVLLFVGMVFDFSNEDDFLFQGLEIAASDIPPFTALRKHLTPNLTGLYKTKNGFQIYQQQVHPGGSPVASFAFSGILSLVVDEAQRSEK